MTVETPFMYDWYSQFYQNAPVSPTHAVFCQRVYGRDLCQHGYTTLSQLDDLLKAAQFTPHSHVLDVGCGNGLISEYVSDVTGACVHGIDYIPEAITQAQSRTASKRDRLTFEAGDMNTAHLPPAAFDAILALDTLYFGDLEALVSRLIAVLKRGGQLLTYYTHILWNPDDDRTILLPDKTPLGQVLVKQGLAFETTDYTAAEYARSQLADQTAEALKTAFEAEGNSFIYENRHIEAEGNMRFYLDNRIRRYLYHVRL
jgi:cyclopropane fatty-acyl-phospholipid synthase-like methyltransferase